MSPATTRKVLALVAAVGVFFGGMFAGGLIDSGPEPSMEAAESPETTTETTSPAGDGPDADPAAAEAHVPDELGAVEVALDIATRPQAWLYLSDTEVEAAVRAVSVSTSADQLVDEIGAEVRLAREALARSPGRVWWIVRPLAWRVDSFTRGRAQVSVWTVSVLSAADVAMPQSDWMTTVLDLEWDGDEWLLVATRDTPGPTPQLGGRDETWEPEPFDDALEGFQRVGEGEQS